MMALSEAQHHRAQRRKTRRVKDGTELYAMSSGNSAEDPQHSGWRRESFPAGLTISQIHVQIMEVGVDIPDELEQVIVHSADGCTAGGSAANRVSRQNTAPICGAHLGWRHSWMHTRARKRLIFTGSGRTANRHGTFAVNYPG